MNEQRVKELIRTDQIKPRTSDPAKIRSLLESVHTNSRVVLAIPLNKNSATVIFREMYECIRQLGDAQWWRKGYEPKNHEVTMELLQTISIENKVLLQHLPRYKSIRHDINYRGFQATEEQATEIITFWNICGKELNTNLSTK